MKRQSQNFAILVRKETVMQISLTAEQQRFVEEKLKTGGFASASDVVGSALAIWKSQEELTR